MTLVDERYSDFQSQSMDIEQLVSTLAPIDELAPRLQSELIRRGEFRTYRQGEYVFTEGDSDANSFYLLEGTLEMHSQGQLVRKVVGGTDSARSALAQLQPRQLSALATTDTRMFVVERSMVMDLLTANTVSVLDDVHPASEVEDGDDRMTSILASEKLSQIPAAYLQQIFRHAKFIDAKAGDAVIEQGASGDYYYIIQEGHCEVTRRTSPGTQEIKLADLYEGDSFGEEALITGGERSATVTMATDGALIQLARTDFIEFIKKPLLRSVSLDEALGIVGKGAVWLDVRFPHERKHSLMTSIINVPLNVLRFQADQLDREKRYIVCCDTGERSAVAAFVLAQRGFDVRYLVGGLVKIEQERSVASEQASRAEAPAEAPSDTSPTSPHEALEAQLEEALNAKAKAEEGLRQERVEREREIQDLKRRLNALEGENQKLLEASKGQRSNPTVSPDAFRDYVKRRILVERQKFQEERRQHAAELERVKRERSVAEAGRCEAIRKARQVVADFESAGRRSGEDVEAARLALSGNSAESSLRAWVAQP